MTRQHDVLQGGEISRYSLYGEASSQQDPEFIHIEDIQARSRLHQWKIEPHTHHRMFQIVFLLEGDIQVCLDDYKSVIHSPCSVTIPSGVVHGFEMTPQTRGYVITISDLLMVDARYRRSRKIFEPLFKEPRIISFNAQQDDFIFIEKTLEQMKMEYQHSDLGRDSMFEWLLRVLLMQIRRELEQQQAYPASPSRPQESFSAFCDLVELHFRDQWSVVQYADRLGMSQARLNRICQSLEGRGANDMIQDRVVLEAQRHLIYSAASVAMIAYDLGYKDPAYFSRFFKRRTGLTPGQFRKQRQGG